METKQLISAAMHRMMEDHVYSKIATATSFIHALIFNFLIIFYLFEYSNIFSTGTPLGGVLHDFIQKFHIDGGMVGRLIVIGLILFIGYELLPPIGEATMIYYLDDQTEKKDGFRALAKGLYKFFPMLELGFSTSLFKISFILLVVLRLILLDLFDNGLIVVLMSIWIVVSIFVTLLLQYSKMLICLQGLDFFDAMKRSVRISIQNMGVTLKFVIINFVLSIRFLLNMAIIIGIPIMLVTLGARLGLQEIGWLNTTFLLILIGLIFLAAYIEGIIEGFFMIVWMDIYKSLPKEE